MAAVRDARPTYVPIGQHDGFQVDRAELAEWKAFAGLIEAGLEIFWSVQSHGLGWVLGLAAPGPIPVVCETYPRYVIKRRWADLRPIPSKRKEPLAYVDAVWGRLSKEGYGCPSLVRPTVDQVDAMLCALAAEACLGAKGMPAGTVGAKPVVDARGRVLREGYIASP